jgi:tRNA (guanosine-2'-O-)-methyltransferase
LSNEEKQMLYFNWVKTTIKNMDKIEAYYHQNLKNNE